jgi:hypothetical protein
MTDTPIPLSDIESVVKIPRATTRPTNDALSVSSEATLADRITSSPLCVITGLASAVPACSFVNLCLTLLGHLLFLIGSGKNAHIRTIPVSSSIAAGAIGGAVWGGACLATIIIVYMIYGAERYDTLCRLGTILAIASLVVAPPIGVAVMRGTFHGNVLAPLTAMWASVVGTSAVCLVTICLFIFGAFVMGL